MADSKHLDYLQAAISRMAGNSFLVKGWNITLTTLALGLALKEGGPDFALLALLPVTLFWALDAYYLTLERSFRDLFKAAAAQYAANGPPTFDMRVTAGIGAVIAHMARPAVLLVHGSLAAVLLLAYCLLR